MRDTLKEIEKRLNDRIIERDTIEEPVRTNTETQTVRDENGQTITTVRNNTTEEWREYDVEHKLLYLRELNWKPIIEIPVISIIFSSVWGLMFVIHRSIADSHVTSEKTKRNRISQVKRDLESEATKN